MNSRLKVFSSLICSILLFQGCGSDSNSLGSTDVIVERGKVYNAKVVDAQGNVAKQKENQNVYTFPTPPVYPVSVSGGWIDVDNDGNLTTSDIALDINMSSYSNTVTPVTTFIASGDADEAKREARMETLMEKTGITSIEELLAPPSMAGSKNNIALNNAIFKDMVLDENISFEENIENIDALFDEMIVKLDTLIVEDMGIDDFEFEILSIELEKEVISDLINESSMLSYATKEDILSLKTYHLKQKDIAGYTFKMTFHDNYGEFYSRIYFNADLSGVEIYDDGYVNRFTWSIEDGKIKLKLDGLYEELINFTSKPVGNFKIGRYDIEFGIFGDITASEFEKFTTVPDVNELESTEITTVYEETNSVELSELENEIDELLDELENNKIEVPPLIGK